MKELLHLFSQKPISNIIDEIFFDLDVKPVNLNFLLSNQLKEENVLLILIDNLIDKIPKSFFINNNVIVLSENYILNESEFYKTKFFYGKLSVKKFRDEVSSSFMSKIYSFKNTQIADCQIINLNSGSGAQLTPLEREILIVFFNKKQIKRQFLLESVLKKRKDIETKTIETHLTRIRKKLLKINSEVLISSKNDIFYLDN